MVVVVSIGFKLKDIYNFNFIVAIVELPIDFVAKLFFGLGITGFYHDKRVFLADNLVGIVRFWRDDIIIWVN